MSCAIRTKSLKLSGVGNDSLGAMQKHGLRQDQTSQMRKVRDVAPLVFGSLDLRSAFDEHVKDCRMNRGLKRPVMHSLVQFPTTIAITPKNEQIMLDLAVKFINDTFGGQAVFSARLDRDEAGRHTVDVFYSPKYTKTTKVRGEEQWISTTKHGKQLCHKHRDEIERRDKTFNTMPRAVGISMNSELRSFLEAQGLKLTAKKEKNNLYDDRLSPEQFKLVAELKSEVKALRKDREFLKAKVAEVTKEVNIFKKVFVKLIGDLEDVRDRLPFKILDLIEKLNGKKAGEPSFKSKMATPPNGLPTPSQPEPETRNFKM